MGDAAMPLMIELTPDGHRPVLICDLCGRAIEDLDLGRYAWVGEPTTPGGRRALYLEHRGCAARHPRRKGMTRHAGTLRELLGTLRER